MSNFLKRCVVAPVWILFFLATALAPGRTWADQFEPIREQIKTALVKSNLPSLAVAVARDGEILWEEGFGWADRENRIAATEHTMYSLASISKPITATGLMTLVERARVDLDDPINEYLGQTKLVAHVGDASDATVRRVANHTSGLPLHYQFFYADEPYRRPAMDETIRRYGNLLTVPGERFHYSNLGFGVLDYVIARASGKSFADYMRQRVFLPLGLTHTSVDIGPGLEQHHATRYEPTGEPIPFYDFDHPGASAIYSSAHDLVRFGMFHLKNHLPDQKAILSDKSIDAMQRPTSEPGKDSGYGIGWGSSVDSRGYRTVSHSGGMGGVSTLLKLLPEENIAVVALANARSSIAYRLPGEIIKILLPEAKSERDKPEAEAAESTNADDDWPPSPLVGSWRGKLHTYAGDLKLKLDVKPTGDVHVKLGPQLTTLLTDARINVGFLKGRFLGDVGTEDANRRPYHLHVDMKLLGDRLAGAVVAISTPGGRTGNALSHWAELQRE